MKFILYYEVGDQENLPFYDLKEVLNNTDDNEQVIPDIMNRIITEYHAVNKLIQEKYREDEK